MAPQQPRARTTGSANFDPEKYFQDWSSDRLPQDNDLQASLTQTFSLPRNDNYVYHAIASVTLSQVQEAISIGREHGLHAWYLDEDGQPLPSPPGGDIGAYTEIFDAGKLPSKALVSLASNAKKGSHRARVADYLSGRRQIDAKYTTGRTKKPPTNPYYEYWVWSCHNLEWAGPEPATINVKTSHHILPLYMHHFGCLVPSYESLDIIKQAAQGQTILEIGSGNGYWTFMLRRLGLVVVAVDNMQSEYRTLWIGDTVVEDGEKYLKSNKGCQDMVLLLVYPIVGLDFTRKVLKEYKGGTICVAGTQNRNGYTAFKDKTIDEHIQEEQPNFRQTLQLPLPSFAGKDEALFVFETSAADTDNI